MKITITSEYGIDLLKAVKAEQQAVLLKSKANLQILLSNAVGIGEHTDLVSDVKGYVAEISHAEDNIKVINNLLIGETQPSLLSG